MKIKRFKAENFRNIESCDISFTDGVNLFYGKNAQGKTNAVEGIYLFSRGRSFRSQDDKEMIGFGKDGFRILLEYEDKDGECTLEYACFGRQRQRKKNGYKLSGLSEMLGNFRSVLFYPDNLSLVKDGPEERRAFLNIAISQCDKRYIDEYSHFKSALENRNALLKAASKGQYVDDGELVAWGETMARYSSYIYRSRLEYLERLGVHAKERMRELSFGSEELELNFKCDLSSPMSREEAFSEYKRIYTENLERERIVGTSLYGPQRDDILIDLNGNAARSFASQGQQRSIVLALKLAEGEVIREIFGEYPVFLFDDVLSELDERRREYVIGKMAGMQTVITSCSDDGINLPDTNLITVEGGKYVSSHR